MDGPRKTSSQKIHIKGDVKGQVAMGNKITQSQSIQHVQAQVSQADLQELHALIEALQQQINADASPEIREKAIERTSELEEAITAGTPNLTTMEYVRDWFARHVPKLAGTVGALVVHPIVGKIVEASGEMIALEFKRRFGVP